MKVAVVSIMKNESPRVARWAESCKDATYRVLLDTGSDDDSVAVARRHGVTVHEASINPWHFGNARNHLLDLLPDDVDWIVNLDLDEVLAEDWHSCLSRVPNDGSVNRPRYLYTWNWKECVTREGKVDVAGTIALGKPEVSYQGDKITRRFTHRWKGACHEVNITEPGNQELQSPCDIKIYHFADESKSRGGYLDLLIQDVQDDPTNARNTFYLGREYMYRGMVDDSIRTLKHHLSLETAWWKPERGYACRYIARQSPDHEKRDWLMRAVEEYPTGRECWIDLSQWAHDRGLWRECYEAARSALAITSRGEHYCNDADAWGWRPHDLMALASHRLGYHREAIEHGKAAIEHFPADERLRRNLHFYELARGKATAWAVIAKDGSEPMTLSAVQEVAEAACRDGRRRVVPLYADAESREERQ
jgi:tetratricopeptide (TPR) repeat protein